MRLDSEIMSESTETATVHDAEPVEPEGPSDERAQALAEEALRRREAALQHIRKFGDPVLKSRASEIRSFGPELQREGQRMIAIMRDAFEAAIHAHAGIRSKALPSPRGTKKVPPNRISR